MKDLLIRESVPISPSVVSPNIQNDSCPVFFAPLHVNLVVSLAEGTLKHFGFLRAYYHTWNGLLVGLIYLLEDPYSGS